MLYYTMVVYRKSKKNLYRRKHFDKNILASKRSENKLGIAAN